VGTYPGKQESAEENSGSRSAKGNKYVRSVLNQGANAAARSKGTHFQAVFRRLLPRLGYQSAVWTIAHRLCRLVWKILHEGVRYIEQGTESEPKLPHLSCPIPGQTASQIWLQRSDHTCRWGASIRLASTTLEG
jgi:hypothetical protein